MDILKFAAIDIGSNAVRLLISNVIDTETPFFKKASLVRVPLRLGKDVFSEKVISKHSEKRMLHTMHAYQHLMQAHEIIAYKAYATSAMREATNGPELVAKIKAETGIKIEIISGHKEAQILYSTQIAKQLTPNIPYLYIDVGGGSTELTFFYNEQILDSKSFKIGTVRLLNNQVNTSVWKELENWLNKHAKNFNNLKGIGTGGNINKMFKMTGRSAGTPMPTTDVTTMYEVLNDLTLEERMIKHNMKIDRADVIIHAANIFTKVLNWAKCEEIFVPKVGLVDGTVRQLYANYKAKKS